MFKKQDVVRFVWRIERVIEEWTIELLDHLTHNLRLIANPKMVLEEEIKNSPRKQKAWELARRYKITPEDAETVIALCEDADLNERAPEAIVIYAAMGARNPVGCATYWAMMVRDKRREGRREPLINTDEHG